MGTYKISHARNVSIKKKEDEESRSNNQTNHPNLFSGTIVEEKVHVVCQSQPFFFITWVGGGEGRLMLGFDSDATYAAAMYVVINISKVLYIGSCIYTQIYRMAHILLVFLVDFGGVGPRGGGL